ncbi:zinc ribbon domain-containing protein [Persephonella sp.]
MDSDIDTLLKLQQLDLKIDNLKKAIEKLPEEIKALEKEKSELILKFDKIKNEINHLEALKREKELDIQTYEDKILKIQSSLEKVKTNEEYKALLREKAHAEEAIMELEDEILNIMEEIENLKEEEIKLKEIIEKEKVQIEQKILAKEKELEKAKNDLEKLLKEREAFLKTVRPPLLSKYEMIRKKRNGKAVVIVDSDTCTGCFMIIPPKVYSDLVKSRKLLTCPHCGRFLIYQED